MSPCEMSPLETFLQIASAKSTPSVLEIGTRRAIPDRSTLRKDWVPHAREYIATDFQDGLDVDVVADAHHLSAVFGENRFDIVISCATYEHLQYPWIATTEICRVLKLGGMVFVHTVQTFPLHDFPQDYWRFTVDGLKTLFSQHIGFLPIAVDYEFPCTIVSEREPATADFQSFLNVCIVAEKIRHPPPGFAYGSRVSPLDEEETFARVIRERDRKIACLQILTGEQGERIQHLTAEMKEIQSSLGFQLLCRYNRGKNRWLPAGSRRRTCYELVVTRLKTALSPLLTTL